MESTILDLTVHKIHDHEQNLLINQQWEVSDPILSCYNQELIPIYFLSNPKELTVRFWVWDSGIPLCIVPQVYHFPKLVDWCTKHYAIDSKSVITKLLSIIFITFSRENIIKMLGLHTTNFPEQNIITLSEEILVQKFTSLPPKFNYPLSRVFKDQDPSCLPLNFQ